MSAIEECRRLPRPAISPGRGYARFRIQMAAEHDMWTLERYDAWCRLRHDGFRSMNQECVRCGSLATPEEVVEYRALKEAALADAKAKGRVSYIEATYGASPPAASDIPAP